MFHFFLSHPVYSYSSQVANRHWVYRRFQRYGEVMIVRSGTKASRYRVTGHASATREMRFDVVESAVSFQTCQIRQRTPCRIVYRQSAWPQTARKGYDWITGRDFSETLHSCCVHTLTHMLNRHRSPLTLSARCRCGILHHQTIVSRH